MTSGIYLDALNKEIVVCCSRVYMATGKFD